MSLTTLAERGNIPRLESAINNGADVNGIEFGATPLYAASRKGVYPAVELLLACNADVNLTNDFGQGSLYAACSYGSEKVVQLLLDNGANVHQLDLDGRNCLYWTCGEGNAKLSILLIRNNASLHTMDKFGWSPLYKAAISGMSKKEVLSLVAAFKDYHKDNPRYDMDYEEVANHQEKIAKLLLSVKSNITLQIDVGQTPLYYAAIVGNLKLVKKLLISEAYCIDMQDEKGQTPLFIAASGGHKDIVKTLLKAKADASITAKSGETPLFHSVTKNRMRSAKVLLALGNQDVNAKVNGKTILHWVAKKGKSNFITLLCENGASVNEPDDEGNTALHIATKCQQLGAITTLVALQADLSAKSNKDITPLDLAAKISSSDSNLFNYYCVLGAIATTSIANQMKQELFNTSELQLTNLELTNDLLPVNALAEFKKLKAMSFACNKITKLPIIWQTTRAQITSLDLSSNNISYIPKALLALYPNLKTLNLQNNQLHAIPTTILTPDLQIRLEGTPIWSMIPKTFTKSKSKNQGWLKDYLRSVNTRAAQWSQCKLLLVGQEGMGKTTLLATLESKKGKVSCTENLSTDGVAIREGIKFSQEADTNNTTINAWDLGGQEVFYPTHQFFLTDRSVYVVVFNAANLQTSRVEYWMRHLRSLTQHSSNAPVFLVGTHGDELSDEQTEKVLVEVSKQFPKPKFPALQDILIVSCKTGKTIQELKQAIVSLVSQPSFQPIVPSSWVCFFDILREKRDEGHNYISIRLYENIRRSCGISDEEVQLCTDFLSDSGNIIHYKATNERGGLVVLQPQWLADLMSTLITFKHSWIKNGILKQNDIINVFKKYPTTIHSNLIGLLERFSIAKKMNDNSIMVPSLLPEECNNEQYNAIWILNNSNSCKQLHEQGRIYKFSFLPLGFFGRVIMSLLQIPHVYGKLFWRNGMIIVFSPSNENECESESENEEENKAKTVADETTQEQALITFDPDTYTCDIRVRTPTKQLKNVNLQKKDMFIRTIVDTIDTMIECWYYQTHVDKFLPCTHCIAKGSPPFLFTLLECVSAVTSGQRMLYCHHIKLPSRAVAVASLAPDLAFSDLEIIPAKNITIGEVLGKGGFGTVYSGFVTVNMKQGVEESTHKKIPVAIKELAGSDNPSQMEAEFYEFQKEAYVMSKLKSKYLVSLIGVTISPKLQMVLELLTCGDLFQFLHPGNNDEQLSKIPKEDFPWDLRLFMALDIAKGMNYMQSSTPPVIHRDLRSPNIFLAATSVDAPVRAKVADFGMSRVVTTNISGALETWQWVAPEVLIADGDLSYNTQADVYSFGIVCWEIATREFPFDEFHENPEYSKLMANGTRMIVQNRIKNAIINNSLRPSEPTVEEGAPADFVSLMYRCLDGRPSFRPSFAEVVKELSIMLDVPFEEEEHIVIQSDAGDLLEEERLALEAEQEAEKVVFVEDDEEEELLASANLMKVLITSSAGTQDIASAAVLEKKFEFNPDLSSKAVDAMTSTLQLFQRTVSTMLCIGSQLWKGFDDGYIKVFSAKDGTLLQQWQAHPAAVTSLILGVNQVLWSCSKDGSICVWSTRFKLMQEWRTRKFEVRELCLVYGVEGYQVWALQQVKAQKWELVVYYAMTYQMAHRIALPKNEDPKFISYIDDFVWVAATSKLLVVNRKTLQIVACFQAYTGIPTGITAKMHKIWISVSNEIFVWELNQEELAEVGSFACPYNITCIHSQIANTNMITGGEGGAIMVWDCMKMVPTQELEHFADNVFCLASSPSALYSQSNNSFAVFCQLKESKSTTPKLQRMNSSNWCAAKQSRKNTYSRKCGLLRLGMRHPTTTTSTTSTSTTSSSISTGNQDNNSSNEDDEIL